jgi:putative Ca2+/H+ antiporter (TMEM165/GDT1 family)
MPAFLGAVAIAFGAIFVAEFGDKSQLLVLAFATRYPWRPIVAGLALAAAVVQGLSVVVGTAVGAVLPDTVVAIVAGLAFLAVAAWTLRGEDDDDHDAARAARSSGLGGPALAATVAGAFVLGELGDKTMLATFALAASQGPIPTWIGATAAMVAANLVAVVVGRQVGDRLSERFVRIGSAVLFAAAGVAILAGALLAG